MDKDIVNNISCEMIDSHFHLLHLKDNILSNVELLKKSISNGLSAAIDVGLSARDIEQRFKLASTIPELYTAHGLYPSECVSPDIPLQLDLLKKYLTLDKSAVAVGEIGLDFFHNYGNEKKQKELLINQIEIANSISLPVIIHSRNAEQQTLDVLKKHSVNKGGIIHCYSYSKEAAKKFIDLGFYISFAGNLTYKKSVEIQEAASAIPLEWLLLETDSPYLSPQKVRSKKNYPGFIGYTYEFLAELRKTKLEKIVFAIKENFDCFINNTTVKRCL